MRYDSIIECPFCYHKSVKTSVLCVCEKGMESIKMNLICLRQPCAVSLKSRDGRPCEHFAVPLCVLLDRV